MAGRKNQLDVFVEHPAGGRWARHLEARAGKLLSELELRSVALAVTLTDDRRIRALNRRWRQKNHATDVLSFPGGPPPPGWPGPLLLGDIVISIDTTRRAAKKQGRSVKSELERYLVHGLLHLLGHEHERPGPARRMAALEDRLLGMDGMVRAVAPVTRGRRR
jgi:probable rRNA maturation factor